jgi:hypothetical protein
MRRSLLIALAVFLVLGGWGLPLSAAEPANAPLMPDLFAPAPHFASVPEYCEFPFFTYCPSSSTPWDPDAYCICEWFWCGDNGWQCGYTN